MIILNQVNTHQGTFNRPVKELLRLGPVDHRADDPRCGSQNVHDGTRKDLFMMIIKNPDHAP